MRILGISGSLRASSWNTMLLRVAAGIAAPRAKVEIRAIGDLPLYNAELDGDDVRPPVVRALKDAIGEADAVLFASPEYNYGIPGGLKNAIDWASRPAYKSCLALKPCGILTASTSPVGGARAQAHLKQVLGGCLAPVYPAPEYLLSAASGKFDEEGRLTDAQALERLAGYMQGFVGWVGRQPAPSPTT